MEAVHPDPDGGGGGKAMDDHVFIVRLWLERAEAGGHAAPLWRGRVKYLNRAEEVHVDGIEAALQVVRAALPPQP